MSGRGVHVILVHWNQVELLRGTIEAFRSQSFGDRDVGVHIVVVDNGSRDDQRARLGGIAGSTPDVTVVEMGHNSGFGPAANAGLRVWLDDDSGGDWAFVAPHDAHPAPECLSTMLDAATNEPLAGLMCADVGDGMVPVIDRYFGGMTVRADTAEGWVPVDYPHGTLMGIHRRCATEVGLFDEAFFAYCEEADLGWRAARHGYRCGLVRGAGVVNTHVGSSIAAVDYLQQRNTVHLVRRISGRYHATIRLLIGIAQLVSGLVRPDRAPAVFDASARWWGLVDAVRGRWGPPPPRIRRAAAESGSDRGG